MWCVCGVCGVCGVCVCGVCVCERVNTPMGPSILLQSFPAMLLEEAAEVLTDKGLSDNTGDTLEDVELTL